MSVVGIDFGYQSCYIAVARQGGIETIANEYSDRLTPNYVSFTNKQRYMGASSKNQYISNLKNTIWGYKKFIGRSYSDSHVQNQLPVLPYDVIANNDGSCGIRVQYLDETKVFSPEQITSMLLTKLKQTAEIALQRPVVDVVISVPCYFTDIERRAMFDATQLAGLNCLRLMNDTTATALAYGIYKQDLPVPEEPPRNIVFIDMGHSDLQVSACAFNKGKLKMLATSSDSNLGGKDFDLLIANHFAVEFKNKYKIDAKSNRKAFLRLLQDSEKVKKLMSANSTPIPLNIECFMDDKDVSAKLSRDSMEEMASSLFQRAYTTIENILNLSGLKKDDVYSVEVVGGSTRVPKIKQFVTDIFGKEPSTTLNSDEAVARGCALQCAILSPTFRVRDFSITDCQLYPINLSWRSASNEDSNGMEVFNQFHPIPFSKMLTFYRTEPFTLDADYSHPASIPHTNSHIGKFTVDKVVPQSNGDGSKVKIKLRVNLHGIFNVHTATLVENLEPESSETGGNGADVQIDEPMEVDTANENSTTQTTENSQDSAATATTETKQTPDKTDEASETVKENGTSNQEQNAAENSDTKTKESTENMENKAPKKVKKQVKCIDLPIVAQVFSLSKADKNLLFETECKMQSNDKLEKERVDAKNAVEEYVYNTREKLHGEYKQFISQENRDSFTQKLDETEDWLYGEGEDVNKQAYIDRHDQLKKLGDPVKVRFQESTSRPRAFEILGQALQLVRKVVEAYQAKDEKYSHIDSADMAKVEKSLIEKTEWYNNNFNAITQQNLCEDPVVLTSQIISQRDALTNVCNPIMNKPKPKEEPPKDKEKKETSDSKTTDASMDTSSEKKENNVENPDAKDDMDLD